MCHSMEQAVVGRGGTPGYLTIIIFLSGGLSVAVLGNSGNSGGEEAEKSKVGEFPESSRDRRSGLNAPT